MIARFFRALAPALVLFSSLTTAVFAQPATPSPVQSATPRPYVLPDTGIQSRPAPTATPSPGRLQVSGKARAYDFQRLNHVQTASAPNKRAVEFGFEPHLDYRIGNTPLNIGYTYAGATGFGFNGPNPVNNPHFDNTLPDFPLNSPIHELYLQYKDNRSMVTIGDQELNYAWTPTSDMRIMPASYQGLDSSFTLSKNLSLGLTEIVRFEARTSSAFVDNTLLTAPYSGATSVIPYSGIETSGTQRVALTYKPASNVSLLAENYAFNNIANLLYVEGKLGLAPTKAANPYLAVQYVAENSIGQRQIGQINNQTFGAQIGVKLTKRLQFTTSTDIAPWRYALVPASSAVAAQSGYFVATGGAGTAALVKPGLYRVAYGGIASPYSDSYASDPLYTTTTTQSSVDRRSAGNSYQVALVYTNANKQLKVIVAEASYQYSNNISRNIATIFKADGQYNFNRVREGHYKGFLVRIKIEPHTQPTTPYKYENQRFMTEYDF
jgi:hypothetical protein